VLFAFTAEHEALRDAVRSFARNALGEAELRKAIDTGLGYDPTVWARIATELGLPGLAVPERFDGAGAGIIELTIVAEELAQMLYSGPFTSTVLAAVAIAASGDEIAQANLLPGIAAGSTIATLALAEAGGVWTEAAVRCTATATATADGWNLHGAKHYVVDAQVADIVIVTARTGADVALFAVSTADPVVRVVPVTGFDLTRRLAVVELDGAPGRLLGEPADGPRVLERVLEAAGVLAAAEAVGGAQAAFDMAVGYAKERVQFGRVIGSFQAIKHMCADAFLDVESARSAAYYAAWAVADETDERAVVVPLAKAFCSDVFFDTAALNMQVHGGISFTWEHPSHLYYRRAKAARQLWGAPREHRDQLATALGL
jgi:alkylation response protein AidB-like acyl-CoA dehydrogenase